MRARKVAIDEDDGDDTPSSTVTSKLAALLDELEIKIAPLQAYRRPGMTMATACMESILREHGYAHAKLVLMSIVETSRNARELTSPVLWAISDLIAAHPEWAARPSDWLAAFDKVDLGQLRAFAKQNSAAVRPRAALATLLFGFLHAELEKPAEPAPKPQSRPTARMAA